MPRLIIKHYGSVLNGLVTTVTQMITYLAIVEMGIASASLVALYEPMAKRDYQKASSILAAINKFYHRVALYFTVGAIIGGMILPFVIADEIPLITVWLVVAAIAGINLVTYIILGKYRTLLQSDNKLYISNYARCIGAFLQFLLALLVLSIDWEIAFIKFAAVLSGCIEGILLWYYCRKVYPDIKTNAEPMEGAIKQRKDILVHQFSALVLNNTDVLLLTIFGDSLALVSVYAVYNMIMLLLHNVIASLLSARTAVFARLYVLRDIDGLRRKVSQFEILFYCIVFGLFSCMSILVMPFVRLYTRGVNDANYNLPLVGLLFCILGICRVLRGCYSEIINAAGHFKETKIQSINSALINIAVSMALIWRYQIPGLLLGSIVAEVYRTIHCMAYFNQRIFRFNWKVSVFRILLNTVLFVGAYSLFSPLRNSNFQDFYHALLIMLPTAIVILLSIAALNYLINRSLVKLLEQSE